MTTVQVTNHTTTVEVADSAVVVQPSAQTTDVIVQAGPIVSLTVKEVDGAPSVPNVSVLRVSNGTLTDDGAGQVTITTGGGGGGGGAPTDASYLTLGAHASLSDERVLTAGTNVAFVDGGAGGALTVSVPSAAPSGAAGGVLSGTYPNPGFAVDMATQAELDSEAATRASADTALAAPQYLTLAATTTLANERILTPGTGLSGSDGGAGAAYTLSLANTAVSAGSYGSASQVGTFTVDAQGRLTAAANTAIAIAASAITSGQLALARGGTGADLSATGGANQVVKQASAGGALSVAVLVAGDIPSLDSGKITTGEIPRSPLTTRGDLLTQNPSGTHTRLAIGASGRYLRSDGTDPAWSALDGADLTAASVTYAKIQNVSATDRLLGRQSAGAGTIEEIPLTAAGRALVGGADAAAQRTTLGLGAAALLATPIPAASGGTGVSNGGTLTNASNTTITGGGTFSLGGFTLTVPATGTAALLATAQTFTANNRFDASVGIGAAAAAGPRLKVVDNGQPATNDYLAELHTDDSNVYLLGGFNDSYSTTVPVLEYFGHGGGGGFSMGTAAQTFFRIYTNGVSNKRLEVSGAANDYILNVYAPNNAPWLCQFFNNTYSTSVPVFQYYGENDGRWYMGTQDANPMHLYTGGYTNPRLSIDGSGNVGINTTSQFGSGTKVIGIANASAVPSANPSGGGVLYCEGGALKYRGSSGTISTLAVA